MLQQALAYDGNRVFVTQQYRIAHTQTTLRRKLFPQRYTKFIINPHNSNIKLLLRQCIDNLPRTAEQTEIFWTQTFQSSYIIIIKYHTLCRSINEEKNQMKYPADRVICKNKKNIFLKGVIGCLKVTAKNKIHVNIIYYICVQVWNGKYIEREHKNIIINIPLQKQSNRKIFFIIYCSIVAVGRSESETNRNDTTHCHRKHCYTCDGRKSARTVLQYAYKREIYLYSYIILHK